MLKNKIFFFFWVCVCSSSKVKHGTWCPGRSPSPPLTVLSALTIRKRWWRYSRWNNAITFYVGLNFIFYISIYANVVMGVKRYGHCIIRHEVNTIMHIILCIGMETAHGNNTVVIRVYAHAVVNIILQLPRTCTIFSSKLIRPA